MAKKDNDEQKEKKEGNKLLTTLIAIIIVLIWLVIFVLLIKFDVGGFGSNVLRPIIKDVPVLNRILPSVSDEQVAEEYNYQYTSLTQAVDKIKELETANGKLTDEAKAYDDKIAELEAEVERLKVFEENQKDFEKRQLEFDKKVVFNEKAPDISEYKAYYEQINPANAEIIYRQVIEELQYSQAIQEKADIYRKMKPKAAAAVLETMTADVESVAKILLCMKPQESASIIAEMDTVVAAKITKKMLDMDEERLK